MKSNLSVCALLLPLLLGAADGPMVEARLKFISTTRPLVGIGIVQGKKAEGFVIPTDMFSDEITYRGPARLELVELRTVTVKQPPTASDDDAGKEAAKTKRPTRGVKAKPLTSVSTPVGKPPLAWIDLPVATGRQNLILLVTPGRENGIVAIPDVVGSFPPGSNRYLNLCPFPLIVMTPSGRQLIPAKSTAVSRPGSKDNDYYDLQIFSAINQQEKLVFSSRTYHLDSVRKLLILTPLPGDDGRVAVRDIEDRPAPSKGQLPGESGLKAAK
ncbi:MAG: hypothetical protein EAZ72_03055 [Verrucomicrobia bacterium]|jgi:hypothetical protein|nr:MAG: hypothetical protein EAZ72_03055 [Verrucomicrobiota bacterium]